MGSGEWRCNQFTSVSLKTSGQLYRKSLFLLEIEIAARILLTRSSNTKNLILNRKLRIANSIEVVFAREPKRYAFVNDSDRHNSRYALAGYASSKARQHRYRHG